MVFHLSVFASVSLKCYLVKKPLNIDYRDIVFDLSVFLNVSSNCYLLRKPYDIDCKDMAFSQVYSYVYLQIIIPREKSLGH